MTVTIAQPIKSASVVEPKPDPTPPVERQDNLPGATYKIKTPLSEHALYITINNQDGRPFEIFINSKAMEHFQWIVALTRIISMVFRKRGDLATLCEEMRSVFDPKGGYFKKGGKFMPSLVAEIGDVIEQHCVGLGLIERDDSRAVAARAMVAEKAEKAGEPADDKPKGATCPECNGKIAILDGCATCLDCGASKCG